MDAFIRNFLEFFFMALWLLIFARVLMSWVDPGRQRAISTFLIEATEPILAPVRKVLPPMGMIDFSPLIVLLILGVLWRAF